MYTIIGAGVSGLSVADHLQKKNIPFKIYEGKDHGGGHIHSDVVDGFTWDEGPHFSFTKSEYVREYFASNVNGEFLEYPIKPTNYYTGTFIPHPAQSNMYAVPEPLRTTCIEDVTKIREELPSDYTPENYQQWIDYAFGKTFAKTFPQPYTVKYWTTGPENLATDWIGKRVYFPEITDMVESVKGPLEKLTYYINLVRYPQTGGFYSYIKDVEKTLPVQYNKKLSYISYENKELTFADGEKVTYDKLISTMPLPQMIINSDAPDEIKDHARKLKCSQVLIVNVVVNHPSKIDNQLLFVYDEDYLSTRINFTELLSPNNGIEGKTGIQVEVYFSDYHEKTTSDEVIEQKVVQELIQMGLIESEDKVQSHHSKWIEWANVIFDLERKEAQNEIYTWLESKGLIREDDDLNPMTDWDAKTGTNAPLGDIILTGRFAQWKYFWTDDCVLRGQYISENI
jgi:protoporphyrinogen oxidase